ncbi:MAG: dihydrofolate reductase, partial [Candidatus Marinimicrobia bacterium]|nr:dihydrofolate reductase [Candidatus Neomarinimicrobiota bacterium]
MKIHLIWAQDENGGIGKDGNLPWHISEDLKNFKRLTSGFTILMGRNTWESLPVRPLPERRNIVLSSKEVPDVEYYTSVEECIEI